MWTPASGSMIGPRSSTWPVSASSRFRCGDHAALGVVLAHHAEVEEAIRTKRQAAHVALVDLVRFQAVQARVNRTQIVQLALGHVVDQKWGQAFRATPTTRSGWGQGVTSYTTSCQPFWKGRMREAKAQSTPAGPTASTRGIARSRPSYRRSRASRARSPAG